MPTPRTVKTALRRVDNRGVPPPRVLAVVLLTAATAGLLTVPGVAVAATCRPTPPVLARPPAVTALPGGAVMKVWDTGPTPAHPQASVRVVAVRLPVGAGLRPHVDTTGALSRSLVPATVVARDLTAVVAVNGDVFDPVRGSLPVGVEMVGGRVLKASAQPLSATTIGPDGRSSPDHLWLRGSIATGGRTFSVTGLNWQSVTSGVTVYTTAWGPGRRPLGAADVVLVAGRVAAVRTGTARGAAPAAGQTILTANGTTGAALAALAKGAVVGVDYHAETDAHHPVVAAIGRGSRYLLHGTKQGGTCSLRDEQLRPRTAVGWAANGDVILLTVTGRATVDGMEFGGATKHQLPDYLAAVGAYEATGMDGGGSTAMYVRRTRGGSPVRVDRLGPAPRRPVPNLLAAG